MGNPFLEYFWFHIRLIEYGNELLNRQFLIASKLVHLFFERNAENSPKS